MMLDQLVSTLQNRGFDPYVIFQNGLYKVQIGAFSRLSNAAAMENRIRDEGFPTLHYHLRKKTASA